MAHLEWDEATLSIGHPAIDAQHRKLIDLLNQMDATLDANAHDHALVHQVLKELCDYTVVHFGEEEKLMDPETYPEYDAHVSEHMECTQKVLDFLHSLSEKDEGDVRTFAVFASDWVVSHVLGTDKTLGRFLRERG